jgi:hypothetical protein
MSISTTLLFVVPVVNKTRVPGTLPDKLPLCTPALEAPVVKLVVAVVVAVALGMVPVPVATLAHLVAPVPVV